jgi:hypothetical protein
MNPGWPRPVSLTAVHRRPGHPRPTTMIRVAGLTTRKGMMWAGGTHCLAEVDNPDLVAVVDIVGGTLAERLPVGSLLAADTAAGTLAGVDTRLAAEGIRLAAAGIRLAAAGMPLSQDHTRGEVLAASQYRRGVGVKVKVKSHALPNPYTTPNRSVFILLPESESESKQHNVR